MKGRHKGGPAHSPHTPAVGSAYRPSYPTDGRQGKRGLGASRRLIYRPAAPARPARKAPPPIGGAGARDPSLRWEGRGRSTLCAGVADERCGEATVAAPLPAGRRRGAARGGGGAGRWRSGVRGAAFCRSNECPGCSVALAAAASQGPTRGLGRDGAFVFLWGVNRRSLPRPNSKGPEVFNLGKPKRLRCEVAAV